MTRTELRSILQEETDGFKEPSRLRNDTLDAMEIAYIKGKKEQLTLTDVSQQRELLIESFELINIHDGDREKITKLVDITLKSINCG